MKSPDQPHAGEAGSGRTELAVTIMPEWKVSQDMEDGSWEVGFISERSELRVVVAYGLTKETAHLIAAAPRMQQALKAADHTLLVHGHIDGGTALHHSISAAVALSDQ